MLQRVLNRTLDWILLHPVKVLIAAGLLVVVSLILGYGVEFRTSRSDLAPPDDPEERHYRELAEEFGGSSDLIVCLDAAQGVPKKPVELRAVADLLAASYRQEPLVKQVFHKVELRWFLKHGLYLLPPENLKAAVDALRNEQRLVDSLQGIRNLADLNAVIADRFETAFKEGTAPPKQGAGEVIGVLTDLLTAQRRILSDPAPLLEALESEPPALALAGDRPELTSRGYLATHDQATLYILVTPLDNDDSVPALQKLMGAVRSRGNDILASHPGFTITFTGEPATTVEEMETVWRDMWFTSLISGAGVVLLSLMVFRWRSHSLLVSTTLGVGVAWALGAVKLELGYLNLISSSFISTLVGVSDAYSIHPISDYELEGAHTVDPVEAVRRAFASTGAAVTVGAVTTATAFFSILLMNFRGFGELGLVAGVGVLLCLAASLITLPAQLVLFGRWKQARDRRKNLLARDRALVDKLWVDTGAEWVCAFPKTTTAVAFVLTALLAIAATKVEFNHNILDMLPRNSEAVNQQRRMIMESDLSPTFTIAVADDLASLREMKQRAAAEPTVSRFESVLQFLPTDAVASHATINDVAAMINKTRLADDTSPTTRQSLAHSFDRLQEALSQASEAAFGAGLGELAGPLEQARAEAEAAGMQVRSAPADAELAWNDAQRRLLTWARRAIADFRESANSDPPSLENLPSELTQRFVTKNGHFIAFVHPAGDVFDPDFLTKFVAGCRRISEQTTGFPILFHTMSDRITSGFVRAVVVGAILVSIILMIDYRNLRETFLALIPLAMGTIWMLGCMRLLGLSYNFANMIAVPLIIGVGIDNGVHVVHRIRRDKGEGMTAVLRHTGRAILIAGLTTIIGFGGLALASHRGLASLGLVLLVGVGACMTSALVVLPNMLVAFKMAKR